MRRNRGTLRPRLRRSRLDARRVQSEAMRGRLAIASCRALCRWSPRHRRAVRFATNSQSAPQNVFKTVHEAPVSTFSIDVDTARIRSCARSLNRNGAAAGLGGVEEIDQTISRTPIQRRVGERAVPHQRLGVSEPVVGERSSDRIKGYAVQRPRARAPISYPVDSVGSMEAPDWLPWSSIRWRMLLSQLDANDLRSRSSPMPARPALRSSDRRLRQGKKSLGVIDGLYAGGRPPVPKASARPMRWRAEFRRQRFNRGDPGDRRRL